MVRALHTPAANAQDVRMVVRPPCLLLLLALFAGHAAAQDGITIYRCTDAAGKLTLQDSPCAQGQAQQTRTMLQPDDPPPRLMPAPAPVEITAAPQPRIVIARAPQPMYECVRPDGSQYTSNNNDGNPRWVAGFAYGYPFPDHDDHDDHDDYGYGIAYSRNTATPVHSSPPTRTDATSDGNGAPQLHFRSVPPPEPPPPPPPRPPFHHGYGYGGGRWVRDECQALPQAEVCARLRDRREDIRERRFNAQQRERETLAVEERGISARLAADCGGY